MNRSQTLLKKTLSILTLLVLAITSVTQTQGVTAAAKSSPEPKLDSKSLQQTYQCLGPSTEPAHNTLTGKINFVGTSANEPIQQSNRNLRSASPELAAREYLSNCGSLFGLSDQATEIIVKRQTHTEDGRSVFRLQQVYQGIPVFGGEMVVQLNTTNDVILVNGDILPDINLNIRPSIKEAAAQQTALQTIAEKYQVNIDDLQASTPQLWIYSPILLESKTGASSLVWRMEVTPTKLAPIRELVLINANLGTVALNFNQVDTAKSRLTYTANNTTSQPGTLVCNESDPTCAGGDTDAANAHIYAGDTYDFYSTYYGRDSIDNAGISLISTVHYDTGYCNAFWSGYQMVYGDGCSIVADDVVAHELTHGMTQYESNLIYHGQSGAINESFSDIWGEFVDLTNEKGNDSPDVRWLIGEDTSIGAIRNLESPSQFGDPERMTDYLPDGDVHFNSGIGNKTAYLITDGTYFNGYTVSGIGILKAAKIYYEVQTNILTSDADYDELYNALFQACSTLIGTSGITSADCTEVRKATQATELNLYPTPPPAINDEFGNAIAINSDPYTSSFKIANANQAPNDPIFPCTNSKGYYTVWYSYTALATGKLKVDTLGSDYDTILGIWTGVAGNLTTVACNDYIPNIGILSRVYFDVQVGETYYVEVAGKTSNSYGNLKLNVDFKIPTYVSCTDITQIPLAECNALQAFHTSTDGMHWSYTDWFETNTPCSWFGLGCASGTNVTFLELRYNNLVGTIPPEFGNLTYLEILNLGWNQLTGHIPSEMGNLLNLTQLCLNNNNLIGTIPPGLGNLTQLLNLLLRNNQLSGSIPPDLGNLKHLSGLSLHHNQLTGSIPVDLGKLTDLGYLYLNDNQLTGSIPPILGNLSQLWALEMNNNQLSGSIPPALGNLPKLSMFILSDNQLTGSIPAELGNLAGLYYLDLHNNQLTGTLPELSHMAGLRYLYVQNNKLGGEIPVSIKDIGLTTFRLSCGLTSNDPTVIAFIDARIPGWQNARCITTIMADTPDPSLPGQPVNVTVAVGGGTTIPAGTVTINGADTNCQITLSGGTGNCDVTFNTSNAKLLTAIYSGDSNFSGSWDTELHGEGQPPTDITLSNNSVDENLAIGTTVGTLSTTDPDVGDTFTYTFCGGANDNSFNIAGNILETAAIFDYEIKNNYSICVRSTDDGDLYRYKIIPITVSNIMENQPPTDITLSNNSVDENLPIGTTVGTLNTTDPDMGNTFTYSLCSGTGDTFFSIDTDALQASASFDYEVRSSYSICVRTIDNGGLAFDKTFTISVTDVNEPPFNLFLSSYTVAEGLPAGSTIGSFTTTDPDLGDTFTYTFCGGTDDSSFTTAGNTLKTAAIFDYEARSSYSICVRTIDNGGLAFDKTFTVSVTDVNERATNLSLSNTTAPEGLPAGLTVGTFSTTDPDSGDTFTYAFCGGTGDTFFWIDTDTLKTSASFDYEARPSYSICVRTIDNSGLAFDKTFTISVTDVNEPPFNLFLSSYTVAEGLPAGSTIGSFTTTDPDLEDTFTYSLVPGSGNDNAAFTISGNELKTLNPFNYLTKNSYLIDIQTADSKGLTFEKAFTIAVTDIAPIFTDVPDSYWATAWIERLFNAGVTGGCSANPLNYCPDATVTRAQMAIFLLRGEHGSSYTPPAVGADTGFSDVPTNHWAAAWIEQLAAEGITGGCAPGKYCPESPVTRDQMAIFLLRAKYGSYSPPPATGVFSDVPATHWAAVWIEQLAAKGITSGCGTGIYCPDDIVTRAQMAVFLVRTFGLP